MHFPSLYHHIIMKCIKSILLLFLSEVVIIVNAQGGGMIDLNRTPSPDISADQGTTIVESTASPKPKQVRILSRNVVRAVKLNCIYTLFYLGTQT